MNDDKLRYGVWVNAEDVRSELVVVVSLLEELRKCHPRVYPIAVEAVQKLNDQS